MKTLPPALVSDSKRRRALGALLVAAGVLLLGTVVSTIARSRPARPADAVPAATGATSTPR